MAAKSTKRKKIRLKKSVRRTIAALLMVTALIVAAVPVQDVVAVTDESTGIPDVNTIVANFGYCNSANASSNPEGSTSVLPTDTTVMLGFPMQEEVVVREDGTSNEHKYFKINMQGMLDSGTPVPIYKLKRSENSLLYDCISQYIGSGGSGFQPSDSVNLGDAVCFNNGTITAQPDYNVTRDGKLYRYHEEVINLTNTPAGTYSVLKVTISELDMTVSSNPSVLSTETMYTVNASQPIYYIADKAFQGNANFRNLNIPIGIIRIGDYAFEGCSNLAKVTFGGDCKSVGVMSFANCSGLTEVEIKDLTELAQIGDGAFANCPFPSITFPITLRMIGSGAFYGCFNLNDTIDSYSSSSMFRRLNGGDELKIGNYVFANCGNMTEMKMYRNIQVIGTGTAPTTGDGTFAGCGNLQRVELPENFGTTGGQTTLAKGTFYGCGNLKYVRFHGTRATATDREFITEANAEPGETPNVPNSFAIWGLMPSNNPDVYEYSKKNGNTYMYLNSDGVLCYELSLKGYKFIFNENGVITGCTPDTDPTKVEDELVIPSVIGDMSITEIGASAFKDLASTSNKPTVITIPDTITKIGDNAFQNCAKIEKVNINTKGVDIGNSAFADNSALKGVYFTQTDGAGGGTALGEACFKNCPAMEIIQLRNDDFSGDSINDVNITSIGNEAFKTGRTTPYSDTKLGVDNIFLLIKGKMDTTYAPYSFALDGNNTVSAINDSYVTYYSGNPQNLTARYSKTLNDNAGGVSLLTYPNINTVVGTVSGNNVTVHDLINNAAGGGLITLNQQDIIDNTMGMSIPLGIDSIDNAKNTVSTVSANKYFTAVNDSVDHSHGLTNLNLYGVTSLPSAGQAFSENENLGSVTFHSDVTDISTQPFYHSDNLSSVTFAGEGTKETATPENPYYWCTNGIVYSYDGTDTTIEEVLPGRGSIVGQTTIDALNDPDIASVTKITPGAFMDCDIIREVDLSSAEGLKVIPEDCFYSCDMLTDLVLPESVNQIDDSAFAECNDYINVTIPSVEVDIADNAFSGDLYATSWTACIQSDLPIMTVLYLRLSA